mmetsp:Transcript_1890/g.2815  ORF Transcript_1890/g.2815 Transcript_1890/m.2815 type:complete len:148 (-) Transcript_1890:308-751(-)|eukprot:jgi/Bigna1/139614/aug1.51_g14322
MSNGGSWNPEALPPPCKPIYYRIVGQQREFTHDIEVKKANFGRERATPRVEEEEDVPCYPLGKEKKLSRKHIQIEFSDQHNSWRITCLGKNGITLTLLHDKKGKDGNYKIKLLSTGESYNLKGLTPIRTSTGSVKFWFQPAIQNKKD